MYYFHVFVLGEMLAKVICDGGWWRGGGRVDGCTSIIFYSVLILVREIVWEDEGEYSMVC